MEIGQRNWIFFAGKSDSEAFLVLRWLRNFCIHLQATAESFVVSAVTHSLDAHKIIAFADAIAEELL